MPYQILTAAVMAGKCLFFFANNNDLHLSSLQFFFRSFHLMNVSLCLPLSLLPSLSQGISRCSMSIFIMCPRKKKTYTVLALMSSTSSLLTVLCIRCKIHIRTVSNFHFYSFASCPCFATIEKCSSNVALK